MPPPIPNTHPPTPFLFDPLLMYHHHLHVYPGGPNKNHYGAIKDATEITKLLPTALTIKVKNTAMDAAGDVAFIGDAPPLLPITKDMNNNNTAKTVEKGGSTLLPSVKDDDELTMSMKKIKTGLAVSLTLMLFLHTRSARSLAHTLSYSLSSHTCFPRGFRTRSARTRTSQLAPLSRNTLISTLRGAHVRAWPRPTRRPTTPCVLRLDQSVKRKRTSERRFRAEKTATMVVRQH